jgi:hypothetical protein
MDIKQTGCEGADWIHLAQAKGSCENSNQCFVSIKCQEFHD